MNITIVSLYYAPEDFRITDIAKALAADGHRVRVITGLPDYANPYIPKEYRFFRRRREVLDGVSVTRIPIIARRKGLFFRVLNYLSFVVSGWIYTRFCSKKTDIVISYETSPVTQILPAISLANRAGVPLLIYCLDIWPACLKAWNVTETHPLFRLMHRVSRAIYRKGDLVAISSPAFRKYLRDYNGVDEEKIVDLPQHAEDIYADIAGRFEPHEGLHFLYAGNIGAVQRVDVLVRAAALVTSDIPFYIHIVGDGSEKEACEQLARQLGVSDKVIFHGRHPLSEMPRFYTMADCFLLTISGDEIGSLTLPAKLQGYMSAGKPIVASAAGATAEVVEAAGCGWHCPPGDPEQLARTLQQAIENRAAFARLGENGRRYFNAHFTKDIFMERLYNAIGQLTVGRKYY